MTNWNNPQCDPIADINRVLDEALNKKGLETQPELDFSEYKEVSYKELERYAIRTGLLIRSIGPFIRYICIKQGNTIKFLRGAKK